MAKTAGSNYPRVEVRSRREWRQWLRLHHSNSRGVWLVTQKRGSDAFIPYADLVEEALAFGWVDSLPRALDATRSMRLMTPRKAGSAWSKVNKARIDSLVSTGAMTAAGSAIVRAAKKDGSWSRLDAVEALTIPRDLATALRANAKAKANFDEFPRSSKRLILEWILNAKRLETRLRRIEDTVAKAATGVRANHYRG